MENKLYVGHLAGDVAASAAQELFEPYGFVMDVKLTTDRAGRAAGFGVMAMAMTKPAAMGLNGTSLHWLVTGMEPAAEECRGSGGAT